jgi:hypothetical protein
VLKDTFAFDFIAGMGCLGLDSFYDKWAGGMPHMEGAAIVDKYTSRI